MAGCVGCQYDVMPDFPCQSFQAVVVGSQCAPVGRGGEGVVFQDRKKVLRFLVFVFAEDGARGLFQFDGKELAGFAATVNQPAVDEVVFLEFRKVYEGDAPCEKAEDKQVAAKLHFLVCARVLDNLDDGVEADGAFVGLVHSGIDMGERVGLFQSQCGDTFVVHAVEHPHVEGTAVSCDAPFMEQIGFIVFEQFAVQLVKGEPGLVSLGLEETVERAECRAVVG